MTDRRTGEEEEISYHVPVEWTGCNFGGHRPWFSCPETGCSRRVEKLYKPPGQIYFACRHCHDITYRRCNISGKPVRVAMYKKRKIAEKLGEEDPDGSVWATKPFKPKNMHWETYEELIQEWDYWNDLHNIFVDDLEKDYFLN